jgi:DSF synthase
MRTIEKLLRKSSYPTLRVESDPAGTCHWMRMHADIGSGVRPCFRTGLMNDMWGFLSSITLREDQRANGRLRHVVADRMRLRSILAAIWNCSRN